MIDRDDLRMIVTERFGHEWDGSEDDLDAILALDVEPPVRHWEGEARAAFDQALANAPQDAAFGQPELWLQRAQVAAQIASVEQARIGNLIAWKALRQAASTSPSSLPNAGDAISDEIEASLGILDPGSDPLAEIRAALEPLVGRHLEIREALDALARVATLSGLVPPQELAP